MPRMSILGVGHVLFSITTAYGALALVLTRRFPDLFSLAFIPRPVFLVPALILLMAGAVLLPLSLRSLFAAYQADKLVTTGIFRFSRNPVYMSWILFLIPGIVLCFRSWPMLLTPLVAYVLFRALIRKEEAYLEERFGEDYRDYKSRVRRLLPVPASGKRSP